MGYLKIELPFWIKKPVLALGAHTKNTLCFVQNNLAHITQIHQNLNDPGDFLRFQKAVKGFLKRSPKIVAYDLHPEYQSTKYIRQLSAKSFDLSAVQHHHAHIASCMAENGLKNQKVIGVAFDGTGLGLDNTLWGAEFLICDYKNFIRIGHLREIPLLGAEKAILEPWRIAALWLYLIYRENLLNLKLNFVKHIAKDKWQILKKMYLSNFNAPLASSMGRLFDAVASIVLLKFKARFEGDLAMELERMAFSSSGQQLISSKVKGYRFKIIRENDTYIIEPLPVFKEIVLNLKAKDPKEEIAYRFHFTVAQMIDKMCLSLRREFKIDKVALSGGVFQNRLLANLSSGLLLKDGFKIFTHKRLPCNDASLSLGQAIIGGVKS
ncbi:MAG: hypothetical protein NC908_01665 [Candidatus Omnitrophica bacterium]|nr:hypothetical protein [Candidatus Omnitrophota bacterium]